MIFQILGLIALCNSAVTRRLLQEEGEVALGGGWSEGHDVSEEEVGVWQNAVSKNSEGLLQNVDVATLGEPVSVTTQVVAGTNYRFVFADGSTATVYECPWENILDVTDIQVAKKETPLAMVGSDAGGIGPEWTWNSKVEAPAGVKDMGSWKKAVYTEEQQQRLFVDEDGSPLKITDILLNRWGTGDEPNNNEDKVIVGADGHGLPPRQKQLLGADGHGLGPEWTRDDNKEVIVGADGHGLPPRQKQLLGADGHGLGPEWTRDDNKQVIVGTDGHGLPPQQQQQLFGADGHGLGPEGTREDNQPAVIVGADGHGLPPRQKQLLGADGHGLGPEWTRDYNKQVIVGADGHGLPPMLKSNSAMLGADGHGLGPEWTRDDNKPSMFGADGHGLGPQWTRENTFGGDGHDQQAHGLLGANGHGLGPKWTRKTNEPILGANGHGLGPIWTRGGIRLGSAGHGEGPKWTYDRTMENPEGEKDMGDYTMKVYTPEQQDRLGVTELGEKLLKKSSAKNKKITV